jgi:hypothetical protein
MYKLKLSRREKKELAYAKWLLVALAVAGIGVTIWLAWVRPAQREAAIGSFAGCQAAGYPIQDSYPEVCLTKNGQRFVNPAQHQAHQDSQAGADKLVPPINPDLLYLTLDEWGVRVPLTGQTFDLMYAHIRDGLNDRMTFTYRRLVQAGLCPGDVGLSLTRSTARHEPPYSPTNPEPLAHASGYYFYAAFAGSPCYDPENAGQAELVKQIAGEQSLTQATAALLRSLQAEPGS